MPQILTAVAIPIQNSRKLFRREQYFFETVDVRMRGQRPGRIVLYRRKVEYDASWALPSNADIGGLEELLFAAE